MIAILFWYTTPPILLSGALAGRVRSREKLALDVLGVGVVACLQLFKVEAITVNPPMAQVISMNFLLSIMLICFNTTFDQV
jgi:stage V sporulation protein SpoVS